MGNLINRFLFDFSVAVLTLLVVILTVIVGGVFTLAYSVLVTLIWIAEAMVMLIDRIKKGRP